MSERGGVPRMRMRIRTHMRTRGLAAAGVALVSLAASAGLVVGARSMAALELPGMRSLLRLEVMPREAMGLAWTPRVVWPDQLQSGALDRLAAMVVGLVLAAAAVALLNALVLLLDAGASRRREVAVRAALGATPRGLLALLFADVRRVAFSALALGLLLGLALAGLLRATWPGAVAAVGAASAAATLLPAVLVLMALAVVVYVFIGFTVGRALPLARDLAVGGRATADRGEAFRRRALSATQMGAAGAVALGALALAVSLGGAGAADGADMETVAVPVRGPVGADGAAWAALLARIREMPGIEAESLATPGAVLGLGVRDYATAQCGACVRGMIPMPFVGARVDHHAVGPGFFRAAGLAVTSGRGVDATDVAGATRVAVVNRTFANAAFEDGEPIGHLVRIGAGLDDWVEVVGVVEDTDPRVVGGDDLDHAALYLSALQQGPSDGDVLLRGSPEAVEAVRDLLDARGFSPGAAQTLAEVRRAAAAPLLWVARVAVVLALVTLLLAVHGAHATALQVTRRRSRELAVRRVLGATDRRVLAHTLGGSARASLWGGAIAVFLGSFLVALLRQGVGGVAALGPDAYLAVVALLLGSALLASARAVREALTVEPARAAD
jgi:hypothetical protein